MGLNFRASVLLLTLAGLYGLSETTSSDNYPGVIELVGFSNRRARTYYTPAEAKPTAAPAAAKMQADIETVKQNIEKYNKLLTLDTKNLPESQKDMLERIVERVARLKESLDITDHVKENTNATKSLKPEKNENESKEASEDKENSTFIPTDVPANFEEAEEEDKTEPTLVLDETTLLQLQTSMDKLAAAQAAVTSQATQTKEFPATTEMMAEHSPQDQAQQTTESPDTEEEYEGTTFEPSTDTTDPADQFVAARSNSNMAGITAASDETETIGTLSTTVGSQRTLTTSGKISKTRPTKRPHYAANKNANSAKRRPSTGAYNKNASNKQKLSSNAVVTQPSLQQQQYQKISQKPQQQQYQQQPSAAQYGQQQNYQSQPPKAISPSSISLDKYNTAPANVAASYGINAVSAASNTYVSSASPLSSASPSLSSSASLSSAASTASQDLVYDAQVNASAIIDSLNNNAREEEYYQQKQSLQTGVVTNDKVC